MTDPAIATGLDHIGVVVANLPAAVAAWAALGFTPSGPDGRRIMLRHGYIELLAQDPAAPSATLARLLALGEGAHVLTLRVPSAAAAATRLARAGLPADILPTDRPADGDPTQRARFLRIPLPDADPRLQLLEHQTPDLVWQPRYLAHPNGATALAAVTLTTATPAIMAARLSRTAGRPVVPDPAGGYALPLAEGRVRILPGNGAPRITGITLRAAAQHKASVTGVEIDFTK